ncbi:hypothetical protein ONA91_34230 [Micromonospora sp. DR5-3]|nr:MULTISPECIES: hypothetical protein [unclassified Micromonospora]MCW3819510.1 hypothetical protein [Micromonospora sp. DR5-3]
MGHLVQPSRGRIPEDLLEKALADEMMARWMGGHSRRTPRVRPALRA